LYYTCLEKLVELCLGLFERQSSIAVIDQSMEDHVYDLMINALLTNEL
jgi:hypothetical protein